MALAVTEKLIQDLESLNSTVFTSEVERLRARDALFAALRRVQSPWDIVWDQNWVNPATNASVKTLIDAGIFSKWADAGGAAKTSTELAELVGADVLLIRRIMRQICGQHLVNETAEDTFSPTPWAKALAKDPTLASTYGKFYSHLNCPIFASLPYFLKERGFKNPTNVRDSNWQYWKGRDHDFFNDVTSEPELAAHFHDAMQCHSKYNLTPWLEIYPTENILKSGKYRPNCPLVVDIGGSKGHDLEKFHHRHPNIPIGSLILQDLPDVVEGLKLPEAITPQAYNFFEEQPVKGAAVYFLHNVLHDWPDERAMSILENVAGAMEKGFSKLLIHESLISSVRPLARVTTSDITMMACLSARERDESEWRVLIEKSGLQVIKIWRLPQSMESIIETEVAHNRSSQQSQ
ncbi:hypothetical protein NQ176_g796 [Zarea fungicola]|uniref:Uncharacterized protein n=1 Tax=Zarea fungicola TaxID=93591 RepID=A0ACC1NVD2_9HYPO|nr:hypothetical protein NQ176_g796 [Lecanicillium fungicola]